MDSSEADYASGASGASQTYPVQCSSLRKNGYVMIKDRPCKVVDMSTSKTGKHGHAKVHLVGIDIFTGKKYEDLCPSTHNINVPNVSRVDYQLADIDDEGFANLMTDKGETREDLKIPSSELGDKIKEEFAKAENDDAKVIMVTVMKAIDDEHIVAYKNSTN